MTGRTFLHYKVLERLGEGGMGVVWKARDTHLDRFVALKTLRSDKLADPDRKRRFVEEAKAASALNHANIVHIYDIAEAEETIFIAMEYVPGKTLEEVIARRRLRVNDALKYAVQMADALAKAHSAGIIHRDLKPGNVMVSDDGHVKILDFGLAKLTETAETSEDAPTRTLRPQTEEGRIAGTIAYMSPEQAEGKKLDPRSDIFSFGVVLYEMLTGRRAFQEGSRISTLSAIIHKQPAPLPAAVPHDLQKIVARCLRKDPARRFQHMDDVKIALQELIEESEPSGPVTSVASPGRRRRPWVWAVAVLVVAAVSFGGWWLRRSAPETEMRIAPLTTQPGSELYPTFSPGGDRVAFSWNGEKRDNWDVYIKLIDSAGLVRLTTSPARDIAPAWSPDGRSIAFLREVSGEKAAVVVIPAIGGPERTLSEVWSPLKYYFSSFLAWSPDSRSLIVASPSTRAEPVSLMVLSAETGEKRRLTSPPAGWFGDADPAFSPDGSALAFQRSRGFGASEIYLLMIGRNLMPSGEPKRLTSMNRLSANPLWTADGRDILFIASDPIHGQGLWRIPASASGHTAAKREPLPISSSSGGVSSFAISRQGDRLVYASGSSDVHIWRIQLLERGGGIGRNVASASRLIASSVIEGWPQYSPDGRRIAFVSNRSGRWAIWVSDADGSNAVELARRTMCGLPRWSPDGRRIVFDSDTGGQWDIYVTDTSFGRAVRLTPDPADDSSPTWSRDGKGIYFQSRRSGRSQVWRIDNSGANPVQVTKDGGNFALESTDGETLYFSKDDGTVWRMPVAGGQEEAVLQSIEWISFDVVNQGIYFISKAADGKFSIRFLDFATAKIRTIAPIPGPAFFGLSVAPDNRSFLYTQIDREENDLMLVENFR